MRNATVQKDATRRIPVIDAIRGMALFGILYVHLHDGYNGFPSAAGSGWWDAAATWVYDELFLAKAYLVFSFLFGLSFALQLGRAEERGCDFRGRFLWRLVLLFVFGIVNTLFYGGDILMVFAVFGAVLVPFWKAPVRVVAAVALLLGMQMPFIVDALAGGGEPCLLAICQLLNSHVTPMPDAASASWGELARWNAIDGLWVRLSYMIGSGRLGAMLAMFLCGMLAGRKGLYGISPGTRSFWSWVAIAAVVVFAVLSGVEAYLSPSLLAAWAPAFAPWKNMAAVAAFPGVCFLLPDGSVWEKALRPFRAAGRASLSCYIGQSVVGTSLLFGWGMGLAPSLSSAEAAGVAVLVFGVQATVCLVWFRYCRYGPLEWLWRSATYGSFQPMRR